MKARTKIFNYGELLEKLQELSPEQLKQDVALVDEKDNPIKIQHIVFQEERHIDEKVTLQVFVTNTPINS